MRLAPAAARLLATVPMLARLASAAGLYDSLAALAFRNPGGDAGTSRASDVLAHKGQCVLYSEIDNVTSVNKGWDVGAGVGWELQYPYGANRSIPPTGIRSAVPLGGMGTGNFELRGDGAPRRRPREFQGALGMGPPTNARRSAVHVARAGTFHQWCIESQSPGGGAKLDIGALDEAVLGVRVGGKVRLRVWLVVNPGARQGQGHRWPATVRRGESRLRHWRPPRKTKHGEA